MLAILVHGKQSAHVGITHSASAFMIPTPEISTQQEQQNDRISTDNSGIRYRETSRVYRALQEIFLYLAQRSQKTIYSRYMFISKHRGRHVGNISPWQTVSTCRYYTQCISIHDTNSRNQYTAGIAERQNLHMQDSGIRNMVVGIRSIFIRRSPIYRG